MRAFFDIDTQIDFGFPAGALYGPGAELVIPQIAGLNKYAAEHGIPLISTMCTHLENSAEFKAWPPHCVKGTLGQRKPAATLQPNQILIEKDEMDLFSNPLVERILDKYRIDECVVYGLFTEYCVERAVTGLLKRGKRVSLVIDATGHYREADGPGFLRDFIAAGAEIMASEPLIG